jgi:hypothetical protein
MPQTVVFLESFLCPNRRVAFRILTLVSSWAGELVTMPLALLQERLTQENCVRQDLLRRKPENGRNFIGPKRLEILIIHRHLVGQI